MGPLHTGQRSTSSAMPAPFSKHAVGESGVAHEALTLKLSGSQKAQPFGCPLGRPVRLTRPSEGTASRIGTVVETAQQRRNGSEPAHSTRWVLCDLVDRARASAAEQDAHAQLPER